MTASANVFLAEKKKPRTRLRIFKQLSADFCLNQATQKSDFAYFRDLLTKFVLTLVLFFFFFFYFTVH